MKNKKDIQKEIEDTWNKVCESDEDLDFNKRQEGFIKTKELQAQLKIIEEIDNILNEDKWLEFKEEKSKPKTKVFSLMSKCSNINLGEIKWYPQWRKYCFVQDDKVFSDRCLLQMGFFVKKLNEGHKEQTQSRRSA